MDEGYDVAQICEHGHVVTSSVNNMPEFTADGAKTMTACPACKREIRGGYWGGASFTRYEAPAYCIGCGQSFPWTTEAIQTAVELVTEVGNMNAEDAQQFETTVRDLVQESPRTPLAATRFKKVMTKVGAEAAIAVKTVLITILSEAAKKSLWPGK